MVWNSLWPDGTKSVKQNTVPGQQNTAYIENTLNNDHFWKIGVDEDGYHRKVSMEIFADTAIGAPTDPPIPTGMDGVTYLKTVAGTIQGFYRNVNGIYQYIPQFLTGTVVINDSNYTNVVAVANDTYGQIWMWRDAGNNKDVQFGTFYAFGGGCQSIAPGVNVNNTVAPEVRYNVLFGNGPNASGLNIRAKVAAGSANGSYKYRILVWGA